MKYLLFVIAFTSVFLCYSQRKINYNFSINTTFTTNPNFGEYDQFSDRTDWTIVIPNALLLRNGFDVKLNKLISAGINLGLDWHSELDVLAIPYFLDIKLNLANSDDDRFYIGAGLGKLLKIGNSFERGNYQKVGLGYEISSNDKFGFILSADFHQKKIIGFENGQLNSFSFGLGMFFL